MMPTLSLFIWLLSLWLQCLTTFGDTVSSCLADTCYYVPDQTVSDIDEAACACKAENANGSLVEISDSTEYNQVVSLLEEGQQKAMIGVKYDNGWKWSSSGDSVDSVHWPRNQYTQPYFAFNCGGMIQPHDNYFGIHANGGSWNADHFCQVINAELDLTEATNHYNFSLYLHFKDNGLPGVVFNWVDPLNYDYFYARAQNPVNCFVYGTVANGVAKGKFNEGGACVSPIIRERWTKLTVEMDLETSQATAKINGQTQLTWTSQMTGRFAGAAVPNGYGKYLFYSYFDDSDPQYPPTLEVSPNFNCKMVSDGPTSTKMLVKIVSWPFNHFCQIPKLDASPYGNDYTFSVKMTAYGAKAWSVGFPGVTFQWQDENNYEFAFVRTYNPKHCFVYGYVINGIVEINGCGACTCVVSVRCNIEYDLKVTVDSGSGTVTAYINDMEQHTWSYHYSSGRVGAASPNVDNPNLMMYKDFRISGPSATAPLPDPTPYYRCLQVRNDADSLQMVVNRDQWPDSGFCQIPKLDASPYGTDYAFSVDVYNADYCGGHPGITYNWVDPDNYEYVFLTSDAASSCFGYGYVADGKVSDTGNVLGPCVVSVTCQKWYNLQVRLNSSTGQVKAYINNKEQHSWDYHFSTGRVGGATPNGFDNTVYYRDFSLQSSADYSNMYTSYNDGEGVTFFNPGYIEMNCMGGTWPANHFCQIIYSNPPCSSGGYTFSVLAKSIREIDRSTGHPGVVFNVQNETNYDFFYARSDYCFAIGHVVDGTVSLTVNYDQGHCANDVWANSYNTYSIDIDLDNNQVSAYIDGVLARTWTPHFGHGKVGVAAAQGYSNVVHFSYFEVAGCDGVTPSGTAGDVAYISGVDGLTHVAKQGTKTKLKAVCEAPKAFCSLCDEYDNCHDNPCLNNGICGDGDDDFSCDCTDGFSGKNCAVEDLCITQDVTCDNNGYCVPSDGSCDCIGDFIGDKCQFANPCSEDPCNNGVCTSSKCAEDNTCKNKAEKYSCECSAGYTGEDCTDSEKILDAGQEKADDNIGTGWTGKQVGAGVVGLAMGVVVGAAAAKLGAVLYKRIKAKKNKLGDYSDDAEDAGGKTTYTHSGADPTPNYEAAPISTGMPDVA